MVNITSASLVSLLIEEGLLKELGSRKKAQQNYGRHRRTKMGWCFRCLDPQLAVSL